MVDRQPLRLLSMGAGVQTVACLIKYNKQYDDVIFADTGDEKQETYTYVEKYLKPFCEENKIKWTTVKSNRANSLMEFCMNQKVIPIKARRWCTHDFKVVPIRQYIRKTYYPDRCHRLYPAVKDIGFSTDEVYRLNRNNVGGDPRYIKPNYPLLDDKVSRIGCMDIVKDYGWPTPPKSACDFCMFAKKAELRELAYKHPERFKKIVEMEENSYTFPEQTLTAYGPLRTLMESSGGMDAFLEESDELEECDSGHCFL